MLDEQGFDRTVSLRKFLRFMDKFFDCLNVSKKENRTRKRELDVYRSVDDPRFEVYFVFKLVFYGTKFWNYAIYPEFEITPDHHYGGEF